jgi:hypothetical protein
MNLKNLLIGIGLALAIYLILPLHHLTSQLNGNGTIKKEIRKTDSFIGIDVSNAFNVILIKGDTQKVEVETDGNILENIKTEVEDGILEVKVKGLISHLSVLNVRITSPTLQSIDLSGACVLRSSDRWENHDLEIELSGASELTMFIRAQRLDVDLSGASSIILEGSASKMEMDLSGASTFEAPHLEVNQAEVECSGASSAKVFVTEKLQGKNTGASHITYIGNPTQVNIESSGAASVDRK